MSLSIIVPMPNDMSRPPSSCDERNLHSLKLMLHGVTMWEWRIESKRGIVLGRDASRTFTLRDARRGCRGDAKGVGGAQTDIESATGDAHASVAQQPDGRFGARL